MESMAGQTDAGAVDSDLFQDIISQFQVLNGYTHVLIGFQTAADLDHDKLVSDIQHALDKLINQIPWLGWQAAEDESGIMKPMPWPRDVAREQVRVKSCEDIVPAMAQLLRKGAPFDMLDGLVLTPWPGIPVPHGISGPMPIVALQVNFVSGGVIVNVSAHHNIMDGTGVVQFLRMLSTVLEGHEVPVAEIEQANRDRRRVVSLIPPGEPVKDINHLRRPPGFEFRAPASPGIWCYFSIALAAQARLVKSAAVAASENDILCAFYWQRLCVSRVARGLRPDTIVKFTRAIDGRTAMGVPPSYMGHMVCHAITRLPVGQVATLPLGQLALALRRDMTAANTAWAVRSYATIMAREKPDRSALMYAGAQNPDIDASATSWVIVADRGKLHALGSWGSLLGPVRFCRPARTVPLPGLFSPMPPENGVIPIQMCLPTDDLEALKRDAVWKQYLKFVG
ncbi:hypothetical protein F5Y12DRAFT_790463 [Xylaria sp. FL1777]|nr:hypothetical protein F5Y12DRAFT_790463 [Xylaria sp. FL1777]